ncbi:hypothetical protein [Umezawaea beigongshangensis]|uniref:hypothetical protein n=1 Tax=Umezawaea beigongshangensis TaxID=2780383 RepID=UPI0018F218E4|nr:hypothetical protein [Umezawaea beigongshangensis]
MLSSPTLLSPYLQDVLHRSPLSTGVGFLAEGVAVMIAGGSAARLVGRPGTPAVLMTGLVSRCSPRWWRWPPSRTPRRRRPPRSGTEKTPASTVTAS